ncbi:unnamed protein product [Trichobilharzia regenti]|uniref:Protein kinase domain-containing protein n=1 Tax=Trichobilharzia regenti TaxID=157069 RepID=A0A183W3K9_TRIRE|nr:unnamed protein product [Trichobilharzia regenti]VDQ03032.1 unnamed protein product [Trichobilharzia regenti]
MESLFKTVQKIDENSTTAVYRAVRNENQEKVILKVFNKQTMTPDLLTFRLDDKTGNDVAVPNELVYLERLQHIHNCVRMIEFINDEENDKWVIVLEDLEAHGYENLAHQLSRSHSVLDERTVAWILRELILTIMEIHKCNIVHCDLKPDNIFFDKRNFRLKLIDFNLASEIKPTNKKVGPPGCTPDYAPPEVLIKRQPWTPAAEVWSIGCTAFVLLCRRFPFKNPWMCDSSIPDYPQSTHRSQLDVHTSLYYSSNIHEKFGSRASKLDSNSVILSNKAKDFLLICLCRSPHRRASIDALLKHPFLAKINRIHDEHPSSVPPTASRTIMVS